MCSQGSEWFHGNSVKIIVEIVRRIHFFEVYKYQKNTQENSRLGFGKLYKWFFRGQEL